MEYFKVNGRDYNVNVISIEENFNILSSENSGRTLGDGYPIVFDALGTFYGHKVTIAKENGFENEYDELFDLISAPRKIKKESDALEFDIAHNQETIKYRAYVSNGSRSLKRIDIKNKKVYWDKLTINIIPIRAQVVPEDE